MLTCSNTINRKKNTVAFITLNLTGIKMSNLCPHRMVELSRVVYQEPEIPPSPKRSAVIIAKKTVLNGEVVNGGPLPIPPHHTPQCSFDLQNKYRGELPTSNFIKGINSFAGVLVLTFTINISVSISHLHRLGAAFTMLFLTFLKATLTFPALISVGIHCQTSRVFIFFPFCQSLLSVRTLQHHPVKSCSLTLRIQLPFLHLFRVKLERLVDPTVLQASSQNHSNCSHSSLNPSRSNRHHLRLNLSRCIVMRWVENVSSVVCSLHCILISLFFLAFRTLWLSLIV